MTAKLRPITAAEWLEWDWVEVTQIDNSEVVYIKAMKKTQPPNDGFVYREVTGITDTEQKWKRIMTYDG